MPTAKNVSRSRQQTERSVSNQVAQHQWVPGPEGLAKEFPKPRQEAPTELAAALEQCRASARRGYEIAKENLRESTLVIERISRELSTCLRSLEDGRVRTPGLVEQLQQQMSNVITEIDALQRTSEQRLEERRQHLDNFSVSLFGRTMAGKSTLMEILTRGDGRSIGTGAQRTTRDVRSYFWNGMEVVDVPGVAAFEGAEDEELAYDAASRADLVLFLVTDDAPQPAEAECLARVRRLGKPLLGICNVKAAVDDDDDLLLFLRKPDEPFSPTRLNPLIDQFHDFAEFHAPGQRVKFVATHLRSRFLAERAAFAQHRDRLRKASRFVDVEDCIVREVVGRGSFLRMKSFVDDAAVPMGDLTNLLLGFSTQNSSSGRVLIEKQRQFSEWSSAWKVQGHARISTFVSKVAESLRAQVPTFAEENYESQHAEQLWRKIVDAERIEQRAEKLQRQLLDECNYALSELARELRSELSYVSGFLGDRLLGSDRIFDGKRVWKWTTNIVAGGLGIAGLILGSGPLGWAALAVGTVGWLVSFLFDDREEKASRAREKLTQQLYTDIDKRELEISRQLKAWFHQELLGKHVGVFLNDLTTVTSGLFSLADAQGSLAWALNDRQKALSRTLVEEGLRRLKARQFATSLSDIARLPGLAVMILIEPDISPSAKVRTGLEQLLGEKVWFVVNTRDQRSILAQAIGQRCDRTKIVIDKKIRVAHVPLENPDQTTRARIQMAQQLTGLHVMQ